MYRVILIGLCMLLFITMTFGCGLGSKVHLPDEMDFTTVVKVHEGIAKHGEEFEIHAVLQNNTGQRIKIIHGSPLIYFEVTGPEGKEIQPKIRLGIGLEPELRAGESYDPDSINFVRQKRTLYFNTPGTYTVTGMADFLILDPIHDELRPYIIRSQPVEIRVE